MNIKDHYVLIQGESYTKKEYTAIASTIEKAGGEGVTAHADLKTWRVYKGEDIEVLMHRVLAAQLEGVSVRISVNEVTDTRLELCPIPDAPENR